MDEVGGKQPEFTFKIVLLGDMKCGKTHLCALLKDENTLPSKMYSETIGVELSSRTVTEANRLVRLQFWDAAGNPALSALTRSYERQANCILLTFDLTNMNSFTSVKNRFEELKDRGFLIVLVANKRDLVNQRVVTPEMIKEFTKETKTRCFETSTHEPESAKKLLDYCKQELVKGLSEDQIREAKNELDQDFVHRFRLAWKSKYYSCWFFRRNPVSWMARHIDSDKLNTATIRDYVQNHPGSRSEAALAEAEKSHSNSASM